MIYPGDSSRKGYKVKLFPDIGVLVCQKPDIIHKIKKFNTVFTESQQNLQNIKN